MKARILGCSGGIGGPQYRTTSILINNNTLIDAGTGVGDLTLDALAQIDHVFVTHTHLDHIATLPLIVDTVGDMRETPLTVYGIPPVLEILRTHIFNWAIWPDFTHLPSAEAPYLQFQPITLGQPVRLGDLTVTPLPAEHTVPAVGYQIDSGHGSIVFTGDTTVNNDFWSIVNTIDKLRHLIIECAFPNHDAALAKSSKHFYPKVLAEDLQKLKPSCEVHIAHLKPGHAELTLREIEMDITAFKPHMLQNGQELEF